MSWIAILSLCAPIAAIPALIVVAFLQGQYQRAHRKAHPRKRVRRVSASTALAAAFLCFSTFYRPSLEVTVKAQLQQQEEKDEDDQGDGESPMRHFLRQLRRIRRSEPVDRLVWRLE